MHCSLLTALLVVFLLYTRFMNREEIEARRNELYQILKIEQKEREVQKIKEEMSAPEFWADSENARQKTQHLRALEKLADEWLRAEDEEGIVALETKALLSGQYDEGDALVGVHAGAGGTDAQDWAGMLWRMYSRFAQIRGWKWTELDKTEGEEAGLKSALARVEGEFSYGYLKNEAGVHRLVRQSPFNADKLRQTSFALIEVLPLIPASEELEIKPEDIRVDVYRSGGHGGQGVNTTDSAVRITHLATGIVVTCQNERSQLQNKASAMKVLQAKLHVLEEQKRQKELLAERGDRQEVEWGNQIRSYVLHPYKLVKDHRTGYEEKLPEAVLEGKLDNFVEKRLRQVAGK